MTKHWLDNGLARNRWQAIIWTNADLIHWRIDAAPGGDELNIWGPFYWHGLTLIQAWISNQIHNKTWDEINNPFPNFNGATIEIWEWISYFNIHFTGHVISYPCWDYS